MIVLMYLLSFSYTVSFMNVGNFKNGHFFHTYSKPNILDK